MDCLFNLCRSDCEQVSIIALFKRELLLQTASFRIILGISAALFLAGFVLHFIEADPGSSCGALLTPLLFAWAVPTLSETFFLLRVQHEPKDWAPGLAADRLFNIVYFGAAFWILLLTIGGMMELAKAGW